MKCIKCDGKGFKDNAEFEVPFTDYCPRCKGVGEVDFYTEKELKAKCTPELERWMCKLAKGFEDYWSFLDKCNLNLFEMKQSFPLLIHRAVEGWNKLNRNNPIIISDDFLTYYHEIDENITNHDFIDYQPGFLTHAECAMLHCLINIFKER